jgi:hypothetical protein
MGTASCQRVREHRNQLSDGSAPQSGSSRNGLRNTDGVDREVQCNATFRALDREENRLHRRPASPRILRLMRHTDSGEFLFF